MRRQRARQLLDQTTRTAASQAARADAAEAEAAAFRAAVDALPHAVVLYDRAGALAFRNRCSHELEGGLAVTVLVEQATREAARAAAAAGAGHTVTRTLDLHGPPPRSFVLTATALPTGGTVVSAEDVSERRRLDAMRRDFVANVSHELRTPLGALAVLAEAIAGEDDAAVTASLAGRITSEAERAARLVDDLLDLSRIEAAGAGEGGPVDVGHLVAAAAERVRPVAARRQVSVEVGPVPAGTTIAGDEDQLASALGNLLDNAVKYSGAGSQVAVTVTTAPQALDIAVEDHGIGIPTRDLERIFERFYRVDRARSRETGGTGLGLAIARHVARNHGGDVVVRSQEGVGSTFVLHLPTG